MCPCRSRRAAGKPARATFRPCAERHGDLRLPRIEAKGGRESEHAGWVDQRQVEAVCHGFGVQDNHGRAGPLLPTAAGAAIFDREGPIVRVELDFQEFAGDRKPCRQVFVLPANVALKHQPGIVEKDCCRAIADQARLQGSDTARDDES